jgi:hypothetical protein
MVRHIQHESDRFDFGDLPSGRSRFVAASFSDVDDAIEASRALEARGYNRDQISVFMSSDTRHGYIETHPHIKDADRNTVTVDHVQLDKDRKTLEGAGAGGLVGGALGAVGAAVAAVGTAMVIPPLGLAVAGPVVAAFAGAGAGAAAGGVVGALVGSGMSEYRARSFEQHVRDGHVLVGAAANTEAERNDLIDQMKHLGGDPVTDDQI